MKRALAVHEAGKGLVATLLRARTQYLERIERVSMVPRGGCVPACPGLAMSLPSMQPQGKLLDDMMLPEDIMTDTQFACCVISSITC